MRPRITESEHNGTLAPAAPACKRLSPMLDAEPAAVPTAGRRRWWRSRWLLFYAALIAGATWYVACVLAPGYASPRSRVYAGALGYPSVMRALHKPIEVEVAEVKARPMVGTI